MDGTKRKAPSYSEPIDLGFDVTTPSWTTMTDYPVSAMRHTQDPYAVPSKRRNSLQTREEVIRAISPLTIDNGSSSSDTGSEAAEYEVDVENDGVWLLNAGEGTRSGPLDSEDDPAVQASLPIQVEIALLRLKQAQSLAATEASKLESDRIIRGVVQNIKQRLQVNAILSLERLSEGGNIAIHCAHPLCPANDHSLAAGAYYFILGQPRQLQDAEHYCLFCLEEMWDGEGMLAPLPAPSVSDPTVAATTATVSLQSDLDGLTLDGTAEEHKALQRYLSGDCEACRTSLLNKLPPEETTIFTPITPAPNTIPASLLESRWAPKIIPDDTATQRPRTPAAQTEENDMPQSPETPGGPYSPVVREKTRFQHLAKYIQAGQSLDERETETVRKWKEDGRVRGMELSVVLGELRD